MRMEPSGMGLVPYKRGSRELPAPSTRYGHREKVPAMKQEDHAGTLILDVQPPELRKIDSLLFMSPPVCGILLRLPEDTQLVSGRAGIPRSVGLQMLLTSVCKHGLVSV